MFRKDTPLVLLLPWALLSVACDEEQATETKPLPGDDEVLAEVNGSAITRYDLDQAIKDSFGTSSHRKIDDAGRRKLLESLVQTRAIAQSREKEMTANEKAALEKRVLAYREELLVKAYLRKHTRPLPVSPDMVKEYYDKHPERFGGSRMRTFEMITTPGEPAGEARARTTRALSEAGKHDEWRVWVESLKAEGLDVEWRSTNVNDEVLHARLRTLVEKLPAGESSKVTLVNGRPYVLRVTGDADTPPKPLAKVSAEIRESLAPVRLKQAVAEASERVMKNAEVAYR